MTTLGTRIAKIKAVEKFLIRVKRDEHVVPDDENGILGDYAYAKAAKDTMTVAEWRSGRFENTYKKYTCDILYADGSVAIGQTKLGTVRKSYIPDDPASDGS